MISFKEFVENAVTGNDSTNVYADYKGVQGNILIGDVMGGRKESYPFEASEILDDDHDHEAWFSIYDDWISKF